MKKKKGGDGEEMFNLPDQGILRNYGTERAQKKDKDKDRKYVKWFNSLSKEEQDRELGITN